MLVVFVVTIGWLNRDLIPLPVARVAEPAALAQADVIARARAAIQAEALSEDPYAYANAPPADAAGAEQASIHFGLCHSGGGRNCVVDGDTFWLNGEKIRIADIDTPETHPSRCAREAELGDRATLRLQQLLNAGPIALAPAASGDAIDRYGRRLAIVERNGASLGMVLVQEGLARPYAGGPRAGWC
jgi:endonuclease YncB( thermonuclease family)